MCARHVATSSWTFPYLPRICRQLKRILLRSAVWAPYSHTNTNTYIHTYINVCILTGSLFRGGPMTLCYMRPFGLLWQLMNYRSASSQRISGCPKHRIITEFSVRSEVSISCNNLWQPAFHYFSWHSLMYTNCHCVWKLNCIVVFAYNFHVLLCGGKV